MDKTRNRMAAVLCPVRLVAVLMVLASPRVMGSEPSVTQAQAAQWEYSAITSLRDRHADDDVSAQLEELHKAAEAGRVVAQFTIGRYYYEGKWVPKDQDRGLDLIRTAARRGLAPAQGYLGWLYFTGTKDVSDAKEAERWLILAAKQGDAHATSMLAHLYMTRPPGEKSPDLVARLFERSAELTENGARGMLAWTLLYGPKEKRDPALAEYLLLKAAQARDANAAFRLGSEYLSGAALKRDLAQGAHWITEASKQRHTHASLRLCDLTARGIGVPKDAEYAQHLLKTALGSASIAEKNDFAWQLTVDPHADLRNPELALQILEPALAAIDAPRAGHVDTLAAAYAATGKFEQAVETQRRAIELAGKQPGHAEVLQELQARLDLYKAGKPFHEVLP
jgi:TPR repeat protein